MLVINSSGYDLKNSYFYFCLLKSISASTNEKTHAAIEPSAKDVLRAAVKTELSERISGKVLKTGHITERSKLTVKLASKKMTKNKVPARQTSLGKVGNKASEKGKGIKFSHKEEGGLDHQVLDESGSEGTVKPAGNERKGKRVDDTIILKNRTRQRKLVWTLTLVKGKRKTSQRSLTNKLDKNSSRGYNGTAELDQSEGKRAKDVLTTDVSVSTRTSGKQRKIKKAMSASPEVGTEAGQRNAVSPGGSTGVLSKDSSLHSRTCVEGKVPRKRRRRVYYAHEGQQQELPGQVENTGAASQQGLIEGGVVSARPSRVIRVPKRFLDDEGMSGLPVKKPVQTEPCLESKHTDLRQTQEFKSNRKSAKQQNIRDVEDSLVRKAKSWGRKPRSSSGFSDGSGKKVGRLAYDSTHLKIYERLKKLTASLALRRQERMASSRGNSEKKQGDLQGTSDSRDARRRKNSDLKMEDVNSPGVVRKVAVHIEDTGGHSALSTVEKDDDSAKGSGKEKLFQIYLQSHLILKQRD